LGKEKTYDPKCTVQYKDQLIPIDQILTDTHSYLKQENKLTDTLEGLFRLGLDNYARHVKPDVDTNDYCLMGVLMVRYDGTVNRGYSAATWCLYLRNYIDAQDGSVWRILLAEGETKVMCYNIEE
jgi:hypothetical protein